MVRMSHRTARGRGGEACGCTANGYVLMTRHQTRVCVTVLASACDGGRHRRSLRVSVFCVRGTTTLLAFSSATSFSALLTLPQDRRLCHLPQLLHCPGPTSTRTHSSSICGWSWGGRTVGSYLDSCAQFAAHLVAGLSAVGHPRTPGPHSRLSLSNCCCCAPRHPPTSPSSARRCRGR